MVRTVSGSEVPSISDAFDHSYRLKKAFRDAGFRSVIQVMLMPREALKEVDGIAGSTAFHVTKTLKSYGLEHRTVNQKLVDFIDQHFGGIKKMPIGVLQITIVRSNDVSRALFAPLELINLLEAIEPEMTIEQLIGMSQDTVRTLVRPVIDAGIPIHNLEEDLRHLAGRLNYYNLEFMPREVRLPYRLHSVG